MKMVVCKLQNNKQKRQQKSPGVDICNEATSGNPT